MSMNPADQAYENNKDEIEKLKAEVSFFYSIRIVNRIEVNETILFPGRKIKA